MSAVDKSWSPSVPEQEETSPAAAPELASYLARNYRCHSVSPQWGSAGPDVVFFFLILFLFLVPFCFVMIIIVVATMEVGPSWLGSQPRSQKGRISSESYKTRYAVA